MFKCKVQYIQFRTHKGTTGKPNKYDLFGILIKENIFFYLDGSALIEKYTLDSNEMLVSTKPANISQYQDLSNRIKEKYPEVTFLIRKTLSIKEIQE